MYQHGKAQAKVFGLKKKDDIAVVFFAILYLFKTIKTDDRNPKRFIPSYIWLILNKAIVDSKDEIDDAEDQFDEVKKRYLNATSLFPNEVLSLLEYINSRFQFTNENILIMRNKKYTTDFTNDNFF